MAFPHRRVKLSFGFKPRMRNRIKIILIPNEIARVENRGKHLSRKMAEAQVSEAAAFAAVLYTNLYLWLLGRFLQCSRTNKMLRRSPLSSTFPV